MNKQYLVKLDKQERKELSQLVKKERIAAKKRTPKNKVDPTLAIPQRKLLFLPNAAQNPAH